jgi:hypothetical protein
MKTLTRYSMLIGAGLLGAALLNGCGSSPVYTSDERGAAIAANWDRQWKELADDTDNALLLRPDSTLTQWDTYHRN